MKMYSDIISFLTSEGAEYADIRIHTEDLTENISILNESIDSYNFSNKQGYGIRVLHNGAWGFASSEDMNEQKLKLTALKAMENAKSASKQIKEKISLAPKDVVKDTYTTPTGTDPFTLDLNEKIEYLMSLNKKLKDDKFDYWSVGANFYKRTIFYFDSEGCEIKKNILDIDASLYIDGKDDDGHKQTRSYTLFHETNGKVGWENLLSATQFDHCERIKKELKEILKAPKCSEEICDVILLPEMMALQTHETIGHALELDRILGYELSYAGGSHVDLHHFGELQFGSDKLTARADGTVACSPGTTGYDDDGVAGQNVTMIEKGILKNAITSRQMVVEANRKAGKKIFEKSGGASRSQGYNSLPIDRMNNINVDFGTDGTLEDIIAGCKNGIILESPKSWSIGSNRENFHFATQIAWKVIDGKISHVVKDATYRGDSLSFWNSLDKVGDESTWQVQQVFHCGKGQPNQIMRLGHGIPVCLFKNVQIGK